MPLGDISSKWKSFGWNVIEINGHNLSEIRQAILKFKKTSNMPTIVLANTIKGKGISFMENSAEWHGKKIEKETYLKALKELGFETD